MKREETLLQQALAAARAKHELTARDLFLEVVELDPRNEIAWLWLTGLLDDLDDCIHACKMVLDINPRHAQVRQYLDQLLEKKQKQSLEQERALEKQEKRAISLAAAGQRETALDLIRDAAQKRELSPEGWRLFADLSPDMNEQIHALRKVLTLKPQDTRARETYDRLSHLKQNPQEQAAIYEEQGNIDKAIEFYNFALMQPHLKKHWRSIDRKIIRLKVRQGENIAHVSPGLSITRLTAGPPLVYFFMLLIHEGINPLTDPNPFLWLEFLLTIFGGFLIALASVRSHHRLWFLIFRDVSQSGAPLARAFMMTAGWALVVLPFVHLFYLAVQRMIRFYS